MQQLGGGEAREAVCLLALL
uniref:Uncharacterized protein n=1 Tax=Arundo donax TaxID=35708 RepID=A0A0A8YYT6_ARUDO